MEVGDRFEALLAAQVGMDGVALDGPGRMIATSTTRSSSVVGRDSRQRLHLGARLDLEDAHRVRRLDHAEDLGDVLGQAVEVDADARSRPVMSRSASSIEREHAQAEQVELDELDRLDVALVVLDHDAAGHRGALQRRDVDQRRLR